MDDKNDLKETKQLNAKSASKAGMTNTNYEGMTNTTAGMGSMTNSATPTSSDANSLQETKKLNEKSNMNKGQF